MVWRIKQCKLQSRVAHFFVSLLFFHFFFNPCCSNSMRIEDRLWIENIVAILSFLTNFKVDRTDFVNLHKVIVRRNAFSAF